MVFSSGKILFILEQVLQKKNILGMYCVCMFINKSFVQSLYTDL